MEVAALSSPANTGRDPRPVLVNDIHSQLNPTLVAEIVRPDSVDEIRVALVKSAREPRPVAVAGGKHAMGGQQFASGGTLIDMRRMSRILELDTARGRAEVEAGIQWPELIESLHALQPWVHDPWCIAQKQTGADRLSIGGALAANVHGRGLTMRPFVGDVEEFSIVLPDGSSRRCSRTENADLFRLAIGGYGLFGVVTHVALRLTRREKLQRVVEVLDLRELMTAFDDRIAAGYRFGDFQFAIANDSPDFLRRGIFSCYRPVDPETPIPHDQRVLSETQWRELLHLAHFDKPAAFARYCEHYLRTTSQVYWSDTHQLASYTDDYHRELDDRTKAGCPGSEMISELYVPRERLADFMETVAEDFRENRVDCIYGTVRLIERDDETFLAWARERWACVIFNVHADHTELGIRRSADTFRKLIDRAIERGGSYFLTYHRYARRDQVLACYPQFREFLRQKRRYDPRELFRSDWYSHYSRMFRE